MKRCIQTVFVIIITLSATFQSSFSETFNVSSTAEFRKALQNSAKNGESDTIILADGTYKTTDDGGGTYELVNVTNESHEIIIQGSSSQSVILSGDDTHRVLKFNAQEIHLKNLSIVNGGGSNGNGVYHTAGPLFIDSCIISGNKTEGSGGGVRGYNITINNSTISNNTSKTFGGGVYGNFVVIKDSTISGNTASEEDGGGVCVFGMFTGSVAITGSVISENTAKSNGGGLFVAEDPSFCGTNCSINAIITNSKISNNIAGTGGGISSYGYGKTTIVNSIISGNTATFAGGFLCGVEIFSNILNSIIIDNFDYNGEGGIYLFSTNNIILNSVFINNGVYEINGRGGSAIYNNYIDVSKIGMSAFLENNFFNGELGFADQANGDFHIGTNSALIDAGIATVKNVEYPETDFDGKKRISGATIDIGIYEIESGDNIDNTGGNSDGNEGGNGGGCFIQSLSI